MFIFAALVAVLASGLFQIGLVIVLIAVAMFVWLVFLPRRRNAGQRVSLAEEAWEIGEDVLHPPKDEAEDIERTRGRY